MSTLRGGGVDTLLDVDEDDTAGSVGGWRTGRTSTSLHVGTEDAEMLDFANPPRREGWRDSVVVGRQVDVERDSRWRDRAGGVAEEDESLLDTAGSPSTQARGQWGQGQWGGGMVLPSEVSDEGDSSVVQDVGRIFVPNRGGPGGGFYILTRDTLNVVNGYGHGHLQEGAGGWGSRPDTSEAGARHVAQGTGRVHIQEISEISHQLEQIARHLPCIDAGAAAPVAATSAGRHCSVLQCVAVCCIVFECYASKSSALATSER